MDVRLDDEAMKTLVAKAIMDSLTPEKREALITTAVKELLNRSESTRYDSPTHLQKVFNDAVGRVAAEIAQQTVQNNEEMKAEIQKMMATAWSRLTAGDAYETLINKIKDSMDSALRGSRY